MSCNSHNEHTHSHGTNCGHLAISHNDHTDYLHDGHLHHPHDGHVDEHSLDESVTNSAACTPDHACEGHEKSHTHGVNCGHEAIPHAGHIDYLVSGHLHHPCADHCDSHGSVLVA